MPEITSLLFNALLYLSLFLFTIKKNKNVNVISLILLLYFIISLGSVILFSTGIYDITRCEYKVHNVTFSSLLYILIGFLILLYPIHHFHFKKVSHISFPPIIQTKIFTYIYVFISLAAISVCIPLLAKTNELYNIQNASTVFMDRSSGNVKLFSEWQERFLTYQAFLKYVGILLMFYYISFFPDKKKIIILLSICSIVPPLIQAIFNVSRGGMIFYVLDFLLAYVIFYRFIKKEYKNRINKIFIILIILMVSLFTIISISRFSEGDGGAFFSVITYLGESYLDFSCSIWNSVIHHTNGSYNFPFLSSLLGQSIHTASKIDRFDYFYYHTGVPVSLFNPVPGNFYVEFGKIGGLIFCFIYGMLGIFFYRAKQKISFNKLIMFYVYSDMCLRGIFGYCMPEPELFFNIIFYFLFSKKIKIIKYK